ncbi:MULTISPECIES: Sec-independent protein translocase protein TatB [Providencia]|uniref:Sec-independent protein translocase protein TatB n=1 Tax=Providencia TaxID=586 RepID=UPI001981DB3A|nr:MULTISPECIES: Sec-independent protein translocase protein TatB [Providencia]HEC8329154.1 Sec-independent protein translocase subunit TatB [Providencia rettgeri]MBN4866819.1 Sec-independent protein translocase subunit TatB [Providencia stuartii]MBN4876277.1 Sec-independent protein translocase subunit TatB [Providencia stuartii]MBN4880833.1 Sec-independent protein translocase subunit TatB [Providencia stuartii]MBN4885341.1 Sec-independent protein translocase subunit TatB [Providencia stuartii
MFDIGFSELLLVAVIGLVVLGPERLPVAVRTVAGWIRTMRSMAANVQNELSQELKLQELQETLKKVEEKANLEALSPELKQSMEELRTAAQSLKSGYQATTNDIETELNKAKEITDSYDTAVKDAKNSAEQTQESDPDPEYAAKMAAVVEEVETEEPAKTDEPVALATTDSQDTKAKNSNQTESEK